MKKRPYMYAVMILILVFFCSAFVVSANQNEMAQSETAAGAVYLYTGSPLVLSDGQIKMLDSTNPDIGATVIQERTLLPIRAISEYFGAEVSYDQADKAAVIEYGGKSYVFPIGSKKYITKEENQKSEYEMDSQSLILDGRTMVPLRVICENVLGKKVSYYDRVIAIADHEINLKSNIRLTADVRTKIGEVIKAGTIRELEKLLDKNGNTIYYGTDADGLVRAESEVTTNEALSPAAEEKTGFGGTADAQAISDNGSYTTTNVQVEGIDEADVVKTDGRYIYIGGNNVVRIVGTDNGKLSDATAIRLSTDKNVSEVYIDGNSLVILGTRWENNHIMRDYSNPVPGIMPEEEKLIMPPYVPSKSYSFADVYNISNPLKPVFLKGHEMEGSYQSSRKNGEIVYMVTNTYPYDKGVLPMMKDTAVSNKAFSMKIDDFMIMPNHPCPGYLIISAINVNNEEKTEVEAITAYGATMYMNDSALYLSFSNHSDDTSIIKFKLQGMKVGYAGSGSVPGYLLNQFSMDEYEGNLRVATTVWEKNSNSLYILDSSLNLAGSVENLAKGETIYSVRFLGSKGYVVTYRTIDPLFIFDLSDPKKPVLTGELKVPGFSNYLHPVGENLLLGIGMDTYDIYKKDSSGREIVVGTRQGGIKFSLFDVSDMGKPKEISNTVIGDSGSSSEALYNHRAIMIDQANDNVAIDAFIGYDNQEKESGQGAVIVGYKGDKLELKGILDSEPSGVYGNDIPYARRILYIGDELYYVQEGRITSYNYNSLKKIETIILQ